MVSAVPRAKNGKNRQTSGAIFSADRAARAAVFGGWVVLCSTSTSALGIMGV